MEHNYIRCPKELEIVENTNNVGQYRALDIILTGTLDMKKCTQWKHDLLNDVAHHMAGTLDMKECTHWKHDLLNDVAHHMTDQPNYSFPKAKAKVNYSDEPYSDTAVFAFSDEEKLMKADGDFLSLSPALKKKILIGNFTVCPRYSHQKTRLSSGFYKEIGAIVVGIENDQLCEKLSLQNLIALLSKEKTQSETNGQQDCFTTQEIFKSAYESKN